jgi:4-hydroxybenzoate polyprenyltransferase
MKHKTYHLALSVAGFTGSVIFFFFLSEHWIYLGIAAFLTFLYSAPKISFPPFQWLKKIAIGKTIFLALAWTYVTSVLPILIENIQWSASAYMFCTGQFFFICSICILFDYRDKADDKADGIRSLVTYLNEKGIDWFFSICIAAYLILTLLLKQTGLPVLNIPLLLFPGLCVAALYKYAKKNYSDYLYYFVLDGLMMLSGLLLWIVNRF